MLRPVEFTKKTHESLYQGVFTNISYVEDNYLLFKWVSFKNVQFLTLVSTVSYCQMCKWGPPYVAPMQQIQDVPVFYS